MNKYTFAVYKTTVERFEVVAEDGEQALDIMYGRAENDENCEFVGREEIPDRTEIISEDVILVGENDETTNE
jgi:hypothetical protein